jgi:hypothetical protein
MNRTLVSQEELLNWMNSQIAKYEECTNCRFTSVLQLREEDEDRCNWSSFNLRCSGVPAHVCQPIAEQIAIQAREMFNLKCPDEGGFLTFQLGNRALISPPCPKCGEIYRDATAEEYQVWDKREFFPRSIYTVLRHPFLSEKE